MKLNAAQMTDVEILVDRFGLADVLDALSDIATEKSQHIAETWQDRTLASRWQRAAMRIDTAAAKVRALLDV